MLPAPAITIMTTAERGGAAPLEWGALRGHALHRFLCRLQRAPMPPPTLLGASVTGFGGFGEGAGRVETVPAWITTYATSIRTGPRGAGAPHRPAGRNGQPKRRSCRGGRMRWACAGRRPRNTPHTPWASGSCGTKPSYLSSYGKQRWRRRTGRSGRSLSRWPARSAGARVARAAVQRACAYKRYLRHGQPKAALP